MHVGDEDEDKMRMRKVTYEEKHMRHDGVPGIWRHISCWRFMYTQMADTTIVEIDQHNIRK